MQIEFSFRLLENWHRACDRVDVGRLRGDVWRLSDSLLRQRRGEVRGASRGERCTLGTGAATFLNHRQMYCLRLISAGEVGRPDITILTDFLILVYDYRNVFFMNFT